MEASSTKRVVEREIRISFGWWVGGGGRRAGDEPSFKFIARLACAILYYSRPIYYRVSLRARCIQDTRKKERTFARINYHCVPFY